VNVLVVGVVAETLGWSLRPDVVGVTLCSLVGIGMAVIQMLRGRGIGWLAVSVLAALILPAVYADAVAEGAARRLTQAVGEGRVLRAEREAEVLVWLRPSAQINGFSIRQFHHQLVTIRQNLERCVQPPVREEDSRSLRGQRIDALIQLDRPQEALALLEPLAATGDPVALDYRGLCALRLDDPEASLAAYREALEMWEVQAPGPRRHAGRMNALQGIGYAARQLDRRVEEEDAYRALVALDATPKNRLLLARCYHDHGKTTAAAAEVYQILLSTGDIGVRAAATELLVTMRRDHFGCLQVPRTTPSQTPPSPVPTEVRWPPNR
jgi:tetratricopeptide (TPR) repeat protein